MITLPELYDYAVDNGIDVDWYSIVTSKKSMSIYDPYFDQCAIAMDPWKFHTIEDEFTCLGHEIGHCMTGSFYNRWAVCDIKQRCENKADKWEVENLIPRDRLEDAITDGRTESWELAEYFCVNEELIKKALCWYKHGNLAVEQYL